MYKPYSKKKRCEVESKKFIRANNLLAQDIINAIDSHRKEQNIRHFSLSIGLSVDRIANVYTRTIRKIDKGEIVSLKPLVEILAACEGDEK